jgi:hypothetical protein
MAKSLEGLFVLNERMALDLTFIRADANLMLGTFAQRMGGVTVMIYRIADVRPLPFYQDI